MKRYLNTLVALVVLAALWFGFNYYNKRKSKESAASAEKPKELVLPVKADQVHSFTVTPRDGQAFTCALDGKTWDITQPKALGADQSAVSDFVGSLVGTTVNSVVDEHPSSLKDFGLDPPVTTLNVATTGKPANFTLLIGDSTPTNDAVYAQVAGNPRVITLPGYGKSALQKTLFDLRDKRVLTLDQDQIQRLDVTSKGKTYTLTKNTDGVWDLVLPPPVRADNFSVQNLLSGLQSTNMISIVKEDKAGDREYGVDQPTVSLKFSTSSSSQTIVIGKKDGNNYDAVNSALAPVFTLGSDFVTRYQIDPATLRDKAFFSFSSFDAKSVDLTTPKDHRVFEQQNFKWKQTVPKAKDEATDKMEPLLNALTDVKAVTFPKATSGNLAPFGLDKPLYTIKVTYGDKNTTQTVIVGSVDDHYYAARSTDTLPGEISKTNLDAIDKALGDL
ncbi:MAG TPA: DUF4340 domain-containing protein [Terriglobia bacterium]|nr:DUF4340 domain-containing protein [Terriglobia bacterium]